jgi:hypothetical protein
VVNIEEETYERLRVVADVHPAKTLQSINVKYKCQFAKEATISENCFAIAFAINSLMQKMSEAERKKCLNFIAKTIEQQQEDKFKKL